MTEQVHSNSIQSKYLEWDSNFLGFPVCEITILNLSNLLALPFLLKKMQEEGARLIYVNTDSRLEMPERVLSHFGGIAADQKVTFMKKLDDRESYPLLKPSKFKIEKRGGSLPHRYYEELRNLCWEAGKFSRFRADRHFSEQKFKELYDLWLIRSLNGELAKEVWVSEDNKGNPVGFVTVTTKCGKGIIGLISVSPKARGQGLGTELVEQAIHSMKALGAGCAEVVTQMENSAACALYSKCRFTLAEEIKRFHFWLDLK